MIVNVKYPITKNKYRAEALKWLRSGDPSNRLPGDTSNFDRLQNNIGEWITWDIEADSWECQSAQYKGGEVEAPISFIAITEQSPFRMTLERTVNISMDVPYIVSGFAAALKTKHIQGLVQGEVFLYEMRYTGNPYKLGEFQIRRHDEPTSAKIMELLEQSNQLH
jgi:hypothetical protein